LVPANLLLSPATLAVSVASRIAARLGLACTAAWLDRHRPFSDTAVAREVSWLVTTELLQLPCVQPRRTYSEDALADAILSDPRVAGRICIGDVLPAQARSRIATAISGYAGTRAATAKIATGSIAAGIGALWVEHGDPQEIPADRPAVKPQGPDKAEMPIYKASTHSRRLARYRRAMSRTTARAHSCSDCCQVDRRQRPARVRDWANNGFVDAEKAVTEFWKGPPAQLRRKSARRSRV
jgi:hypothetical protein